MVIRKLTPKQPNQSNPHTLGACMNCVEALGSLYFITYMRNFPESTQFFCSCVAVIALAPRSWRRAVTPFARVHGTQSSAGSAVATIGPMSSTLYCTSPLTTHVLHQLDDAGQPAVTDDAQNRERVPSSSLGSGSRLRDGKAAFKARGEAEACVGALAPADECPASARTTHAL